MKERKKDKKIVEEDIDLGKSFELASTDKIYVNGLKLPEIRLKFY